MNSSKKMFVVALFLSGPWTVAMNRQNTKFTPRYQKEVGASKLSGTGIRLSDDQIIENINEGSVSRVDAQSQRLMELRTDLRLLQDQLKTADLDDKREQTRCMANLIGTLVEGGRSMMKIAGNSLLPSSRKSLLKILPVGVSEYQKWAPLNQEVFKNAAQYSELGRMLQDLKDLQAMIAGLQKS